MLAQVEADIPGIREVAEGSRVQGGCTLAILATEHKHIHYVG